MAEDFRIRNQIADCGYRILGKKGEGGYGLVYEVGDRNGSLFAFKYVVPTRFYDQYGLDGLNEIDILSRVNHPYIIHAVKTVTNLDCHITGVSLILPLADRSLFDLVHQPLTVTDTKLPILYKIATAIAFLHRSKILHLDIKSQNIVLQGIKENNPYLIDFGLSIIVDDVSIGKYDPNVLVSLEYRAPEILAGERMYNAPVDIWAFGITMLEVLGGQDIYHGARTDTEFHTTVVNLFSNPNTIPGILRGVRDKYQALCIDLLTRVLQIDPSRRLLAQEICDHPLFDEFRHNVEGTIIIPRIPHDYASDQRDILKLLIHWLQTLYANSQVELLFLAVDLFNRMGSFYKDREPIDRMHLAATCIWMAAKLTTSKLIALDVYTRELNKMVPTIKSDTILQTEIEIIHLSSGLLYVSNLYRSCTIGDELKLSFEYVINSKDSTLYAITDVPQWIIVMKNNTPSPKYQNKNITIVEFLA
jgi:serine/threonine protein kinase